MRCREMAAACKELGEAIALGNSLIEQLGTGKGE